MQNALVKKIENSAAPSMDRWIQKSHTFPMLSESEELEYANQWKHQQNVDAAKMLVFSHTRMVLPIARAYLGYGLPQEDLIQQGNIGLMKAVHRFDPEKGFRLATYAMAWIKSEIQQYIVDNWQLVRIVTTKAHKKLFFHRGELNKGLKPLLLAEKKELAERLNVRLEDVQDMEERLASRFNCLDEPINDEDGSRTYADIIEAPSWEVAEDLTFQDMVDSGILEEAMNSLDQRSRDIIQRRWLGAGETLHTLADEYKVSAERIRQIEVSGMKKMHTYLKDLKEKFER